MKLLFLYIKTTVKIKLGRVLEKLSQPQSRWEQASLDDCDNDCCAFTQLLQIQKNQSNKLEEHLEQNRNLLPVIGFNSTKSDLKLIELFYLPILINERHFQPTVNKKNQPFHLVRKSWFSAIGYIELSWWSNKSLLLLEGLQDIKKKKFIPLRIFWSPW